MASGTEKLRTNSLIDQFGRQVTYVRISVTDRCDFRCVYCMHEDMTFLPREQILSLEEIQLVAECFVEMGVTKIRLTGGEPLIRKDVMHLVDGIAGLQGLKELTLTTNGSQLTRLAPGLYKAGVRRLNISLDSLNPDKFRELTRTGELQSVLDGIQAAKAAGFKRIKLNAVVLKGRNDDEVVPLVEFARAQNLDITFIEEMPLGEISEHHRGEAFCSSDEIRTIIRQKYQLAATDESSGGPSRYYQMPGTDTRVGFISPHSHNFCGDCNRVRVTVEGRLLLCLGNEHSIDLKSILRSRRPDLTDDVQLLKADLKRAIVNSLSIKPERHYFDNNEEPQILRFMNMTGG
jgi:cyclic pyranopterin phosphate synthase